MHERGAESLYLRSRILNTLPRVYIRKTREHTRQWSLIDFTTRERFLFIITRCRRRRINKRPYVASRSSSGTSSWNNCTIIPSWSSTRSRSISAARCTASTPRRTAGIVEDLSVTRPGKIPSDVMTLTITPPRLLEEALWECRCRRPKKNCILQLFPAPWGRILWDHPWAPSTTPGRISFRTPSVLRLCEEIPSVAPWVASERTPCLITTRRWDEITWPSRWRIFSVRGRWDATLSPRIWQACSSRLPAIIARIWGPALARRTAI